MRPLSFLILASGGLVLSCGGDSAPAAPEQTLADVVDDFYPAAVVFANQVSKEFEQNAQDPETLHLNGGFAQLLTASQKCAPDFPIADADQEHLAYFALCLGSVNERPQAWKLGLHREQGSQNGLIASLELPPDSFGAPTFLARVAPDEKKDWKLGSWPPRTREAFQPYPSDSPRLHLSSWAAGAVPPEARDRFKQQFGSEIPSGSAYAQVEWQRQVLYHSLSPSAEGADPWRRLKEIVKDVFIPTSLTDEAGLSTQAMVILADPEASASLLLGVLEALAQPDSRWPQLWVGRPGEMLDLCYPLEQSRAWETHAEDVILAAGASNDEWSAALAGISPAAAVGLRIEPGLLMSNLLTELERLQKFKLTRVFLALPIKQE